MKAMNMKTTELSPWRRQRRWIPVLWTRAHWIPVLLFVGLVVGCTEQSPGTTADPTAEESEPRETESNVERVQYQTLEPATEQALVDLPAEVVLPSNARHQLAPPFSGRVLDILVKPGQRVSAGDPLAEFASADLAALRASVTEARKRVRQRQKLLKKQKQHVEAGMQPIQTVYAAEEALADARAHSSALQQELDAWEKHLGDLPAGEEGIRWASPVAGLVEEVRCSPGTVTGPDQHCLTILDTREALVRVRIPERYLPEDPASVTLEWHGFGPEREGTPRLSFLRADAEIDGQSRTLAFYFSLDGAVSNARVGATGRGTIVQPLEAGNSTLAAPRAAVTRVGGKRVVFFREEGESAQPIQVEMVGRKGDLVLIRGDGLTTTTPVAVRGVFFLKSNWLLENEA